MRFVGKILRDHAGCGTRTHETHWLAIMLAQAVYSPRSRCRSPRFAYCFRHFHRILLRPTDRPTVSRSFSRRCRPTSKTTFLISIARQPAPSATSDHRRASTSKHKRREHWVLELFRVLYNICGSSSVRPLYHTSKVWRCLSTAVPGSRGFLQCCLDLGLAGLRMCIRCCCLCVAMVSPQVAVDPFHSRPLMHACLWCHI